MIIISTQALWTVFWVILLGLVFFFPMGVFVGIKMRVDDAINKPYFNVPKYLILSIFLIYFIVLIYKSIVNENYDIPFIPSITMFVLIGLVWEKNFERTVDVIAKVIKR